MTDRMEHIFIDESRIARNSRFQLFGSFWIPRERQALFESGYWALWDRHFPSRRSELKWTKISKGKLQAYLDFLDYFFDFSDANFRCVLLDTRAIDYVKYHDGDKELGFYKFLYFFLSRNIEKDYRYHDVRNHRKLFLDQRRKNDDVEVGRLTDLKSVLNNRLDDTCPEITPPCIVNVEAMDSKDAPEIQIVDIIMGAVGYVWEGYQTSEAKLAVVHHIESRLGLRLGEQTPYLTEKLNIWNFRLNDGNTSIHGKQISAPFPTSPKGLDVR